MSIKSGALMLCLLALVGMCVWLCAPKSTARAQVAKPLSLPQASTGLSTSAIAGGSSPARADRALTSPPGADVALLVDTSDYATLQVRLERYTSEVSATTDHQLRVITGTWDSALQVREALADLENLYGIEGAILVSRTPVISFTTTYTRDGQLETYTFPTDLYFMDLDGDWSDGDSDGILDQRDDPDGVEIWVARVYPPLDDIGLVSSFFDKDHDFRAGNWPITPTALVFQENDTNCEFGNRRVEVLSGIYPTTSVTLLCDEQETSKANYVATLNQHNFEMLWINSHGGPQRQLIIDPDGTEQWFDYNDAQNIEKGAVFCLLHSCEVGKYDTDNYLTGWYVFGEGDILAAVASTTVWESIDHDMLVQGLRDHSLGQSFYEVVRHADELANADDPIVGRRLYYGATLIGDPLLMLGEHPQRLFLPVVVKDAE